MKADLDLKHRELNGANEQIVRLDNNCVSHMDEIERLKAVTTLCPECKPEPKWEICTWPIPEDAEFQCLDADGTWPVTDLGEWSLDKFQRYVSEGRLQYRRKPETVTLWWWYDDGELHVKSGPEPIVDGGAQQRCTVPAEWFREDDRE